MTTQRQDLITKPFNFVPTTLEEAQKYATIFANSGLCPENYRGRPNDILIVWQLGKEIGLEKCKHCEHLDVLMECHLRTVTATCSIKRHTKFEAIKEWFEGEEFKDDFKAICMRNARMRKLSFENLAWPMQSLRDFGRKKESGSNTRNECFNIVRVDLQRRIVFLMRYSV